MEVPLNEKEAAALTALAAEKDMSRPRVMIQALRFYQLVHERQKAGETFSFSGDAQRAREFAGDIPKEIP